MCEKRKIKIAAATENKNKLREFKEIFEEMGFEAEVKSAAELGMKGFPPEDADTFSGNAKIKAEALYEFLKNSGKCEYVVFADDSGIAVDALGGRPGVYSARYAGENASDDENLDKLLEELEKTGDKERKGSYVCVICAITPEGKCFFEEGRMDGIIIKQREGTGGFGYDPVFYTEVYNKTVANLTPEQKNAISHRGVAMRNMSMRILKECD